MFFHHSELLASVKGRFLHYHTLKRKTDQDKKIFRFPSVKVLHMCDIYRNQKQYLFIRFVFFNRFVVF